MTAEKELDPDASPWHLLAFELREARKARGWTQARLAHEAHSSETHVGAVETLVRKPKLDMIVAYDNALGANGRLVRLFKAAQKASLGKPSWWESFTKAERRAARIRTYEPQAIPGLLQHEDYVRELFELQRISQLEVDDQVVQRLERQSVLTADRPPDYWAVLDEVALKRLCHLPRHIASAQLECLARAVDLPHVTLQVLTVECGLHACMTGGFVLLSLDGRGEVCYEETASGMGHIITDEHAVRRVEGRYDLVRSEALSPRQSAQFIRSTWEKL